MRGVMIGAALLLAAPVHAQTTRCNRDAIGNWVCRTEQQRNIMADALANGKAIGDQTQSYIDTYNRRQAGSEAQMAASYRAAIRQQVTEAVAAGKCDDAKAIALNHDDMSMAEQVMRVCTPK